MAVRFEDVLAVINPDEPDYDSASTLGPDALPHLEKIIRGNDPGLAMKATHLAGRLRDPRAADVLSVAARSADAVVRVAAASAASHLPEEARSRLVLQFLDDEDRGVRKWGLRAVPSRPSADVLAKVDRLSKVEDDQTLRDLSLRIVERSR